MVAVNLLSIGCRMIIAPPSGPFVRDVGVADRRITRTPSRPVIVDSPLPCPRSVWMNSTPNADGSA